jgi:hypothetical protein
MCWTGGSTSVALPIVDAEAASSRPAHFVHWTMDTLVVQELHSTGGRTTARAASHGRHVPAPDPRRCWLAARRAARPSGRWTPQSSSRRGGQPALLGVHCAAASCAACCLPQRCCLWQGAGEAPRRGPAPRCRGAGRSAARRAGLEVQQSTRLAVCGDWCHC